MPANVHQLPTIKTEYSTETNGNRFGRRRIASPRPARRPPAGFQAGVGPGAQPIEPLLGVKDAAFLLGLSVKTLRDWIQARKIDYVKLGARVMIRPETVREFVSKNTRAAAG